MVYQPTTIICNLNYNKILEHDEYFSGGSIKITFIKHVQSLSYHFYHPGHVQECPLILFKVLIGNL